LTELERHSPRQREREALTRRCTYCGHEVEDLAVICRGCGKGIVGDSARQLCDRWRALTKAEQAREWESLSPAERGQLSASWKALGYGRVPKPIIRHIRITGRFLAFSALGLVLAGTLVFFIARPAAKAPPAKSREAPRAVAQATAAPVATPDPERQFLQTKAGQIWDRHRAWKREICELIASGKVRIGMTAEQVEAAWGKPTRVSSTVTAHHIREQWVYGSKLAYLDDGVLTALQQPE